MLLIRRAVTKNKAYTVIMLPGEPPKWIPTSDYEHQRILEIYKQDKFYEGIENDFTELKKNFSHLKKMSLEEYIQMRFKVAIDFLQSLLDKEKYRLILNE